MVVGVLICIEIDVSVLYGQLILVVVDCLWDEVDCVLCMYMELNVIVIDIVICDIWEVLMWMEEKL